MALKFFVEAPHFQPSLNPSDSDIVRNSVVVEQLVGTLLKEKFGNTGRSEPYLVESWSADKSQLNWTFIFRENLKCEDGTPINAITYEASLRRRLKILSSDHDLPAFKHLIGWQQFKSRNSENIEGLKAASEKVLEMHFDANPAGLTEYLAMVNFGFFSPNNYSNDVWKSNKQIVSSGPYEVMNYDESGLTLRKRIDWPLNTNPKSPERIEYFFTDSISALKQMDRSSIFPLRRTPTNFSLPSNLNAVVGAPIFLTALVLSPKRSVFSKLASRIDFLLKVKELKRKEDFKSKYAFLAETFYPSEERHQSEVSNAGTYNSEITIGFDPKLNAQEFRYSVDIAIKAAEELGYKVKLSPFDHNDPSWVARRVSNEYYDIRLASVDIGAAPENWLTQMMFCSTIGVSFPDPSGKICEFTRNVETDNISSAGDEYKKKLEDLIRKDASVIPMIHSGYIWLFGESVEMNNFSPTSVIPRAELLVINE